MSHRSRITSLLSTIQLFLILVFFSGFPVSSAHSWNRDYDYDYRNDDYADWASFHYRNFPFGQPSPFNNFPQIHIGAASHCNCIRMRDCPPLMTKLVTASLPLPKSLVKDLRKTSCGYAGLDPLVCCPTVAVHSRDFGDAETPIATPTTTEKPWIWGVMDEMATKQYRRPTKRTKYYGPKESKKKHYYFEFEDPRTAKNCPPSFSNNFDMPHRFHNMAHGRNVIPSRINPDDVGAPSSSNEINPNAIVFPTASMMPGGNTHLINAKNCGISVNARIVGGEDAGPGQFPW